MSKIITDSDDLTYSDKLNSDTGFKPGDLLIDSINNQGKVGSYFMGNEWKGLKDGGTVWLDGNLIPEGKDILFRHTDDDQVGWGSVKNITIRPIPRTQVKANSFTCLGLLNLKMPFASKEFPGLQALGDKRFLSGNFGMHVKLNSPKGHGYKISVLDGGTAEIEGIEGQWGFSGLRFAEGNKATRQKLILKNFYIHDTDTGEPLYLGQAVGSPSAKLILEIYDGIVTRGAAELLQAQHLNGSDIHNLTLVRGGTSWINAFQKDQDNGVQLQVDAGINKFYNVLIDGFGTNGIIPFSSDQGTGTKEMEIANILIRDGRLGHYLHNSNSFGVKWLLKKIFYGAFNDSYTRTGKPGVDYVCSKVHGTDVFTFQNCIYDKTRARFLEDPTDANGDAKQADVLPPVNYMNSGFIEPMSQISQYKPLWGAYHPIGPVPVDYLKGEIVIDDHKFYKVLSNHKADKRPRDSHDYQPLTYDSNAVRSDMVGWNAASKQRDDAPDDLRLKKDDFWRSMNIGYIEPKNLREELFEEWSTKTKAFINTLK